MSRVFPERKLRNKLLSYSQSHSIYKLKIVKITYNSSHWKTPWDVLQAVELSKFAERVKTAQQLLKDKEEIIASYRSMIETQTSQISQTQVG